MIVMQLVKSGKDGAGTSLWVKAGERGGINKLRQGEVG